MDISTAPHGSASAKLFSPRTDNPLITLVVPVFNEADALDLFIEKTGAALAAHQLKLEVIFVNDGSQDNTLDRLLALAEIDPRIKVISLSRNFGKENALSAGLDHARGDVVIPMDVDLQDPPEVIPRFLEMWNDGYDVVYGVRAERRHDGLGKRLTASAFYRLFNYLSRPKIPENAGDFRLMDRRVVDVIKKMPERNRFMKGLFSWVGFRSIGVPYERPARAAGTTKWNRWRLWNFALDGFVGFSTAPLRIWTYIGSVIAFLAFTYGSLIMVRTLLMGVDVPGYASLLTIVLFFGGIQLLSIGVLGEYVGRLFIEAKGRPVYVVDVIYPPQESEQETSHGS